MPARKNLKMQSPSPNLDGPVPKNKNRTLKTQSVSDGTTPVTRLEPLKVLLKWKAPVRPFKKRNREFFTTAGAIAFLFIVILLLMQEWFLIVVIITLLFVGYVMGTVHPVETEHQITNRGLKVGGRDYAWAELGRFWFEEKWGQKILQVETLVVLPPRLMLLLGKTSESEVKKIISKYLLLEEPEETWTDKASDWLSERVPLEKE